MPVVIGTRLPEANVSCVIRRPNWPGRDGNKAHLNPCADGTDCYPPQPKSLPCAGPESHYNARYTFHEFMGRAGWPAALRWHKAQIHGARQFEGAAKSYVG